MKNWSTGFIALLFVMPQMAHLQTESDWEREAARLRESRALWESRNFKSYSFLLQMYCFGCTPHFPARILVDSDNKITAVTPDTGELMQNRSGVERPDLPILMNWYRPIDDLFVIAEEAIENHWGTPHDGQKASNFRIEYSADYGYPVAIDVDYSRGLYAGQELKSSDSRSGYRVSEFNPSP